MLTDLFEQIIAAAAEVHRVLGGPGLVENVYESALCHELALRHLNYQRQVPVPVLYKGAAIRPPFFLDIFVESQIVVEIKAIDTENPYYYAQLLTHLRMLGIPSGLLINFGKKNLNDGISRICNAL